MTHEAPTTFHEIGVVEGFYGRVWSEAEREAFIDGLLPFRLDTYLYAPKHDPTLGAQLLAPLDKPGAQRLHRLNQFCAERGIRLLAGLHLEPPFDPARSEHLEQLHRKTLQLCEQGLAGFAVLFDDVPSGRGEAGPDDPFAGSLAAAQAHAFNALHAGLARCGPRVTWLICPGRYSLDPAIERAYGAFEPGYLDRLHAALPPEVPFLWTGPRVCSAAVTLADREAYLREAGAGPSRSAARPLVLWDNYPVNDAALRGRLQLAPLEGRAPDLPRGVRGYLFNPLLQPMLGVPPAATCLAYANDPGGYDAATRGAAAWDAALARLLPEEAVRADFRAFAALTRPREAAAGWPLPAGDGEPLPLRLERTWRARAAGHNADSSVLTDLEALLERLARGLPAGLREEAGPWLAKLAGARDVIAARLGGAGARDVISAQWTAYESEGAEGLGDWFEP